MSSNPKKLIELIQNEKFTYSIEVTPDVNRDDITNLEIEPAFFAVTWHAKSHQCKGLEIEPLNTASFLRSKGKQVMMHLSCDLLRKHYLEKVLAFLQEMGICNLFLVLGESYDATSSDFQSTLELTKYIREISGSYFCIGVAGFCESDDNRILQLKEKIDAGADFIITQAFFDAQVFKTYKQKCAEKGINATIIPGVFAFESYKQLTNFTNMCKVKVSDDLLDYVRNNDENSIAGHKVVKKMIKEIRFEFPCTDFHFFTLNKLQNVSNFIKQIEN